jgi:hypothetical protein
MEGEKSWETCNEFSEQSGRWGKQMGGIKQWGMMLDKKLHGGG